MKTSRPVDNLQVLTIPKTKAGDLVIKFARPYKNVPTVILTPFWKGSNESVGSIPTIVKITNTECVMVSENTSGSNYFLNVLSIESGPTKIGGRLVQAGKELKRETAVELIYNPRFNSNDPITLLSSFWEGSTSPVGAIDTLDNSSASESKVVSGNKAGNYFTNYMTIDARLTFDDNTNTPIEANIANKIGGGKMRVYFSTLFEQPPIVMLSPWWNDGNAAVGSIETLTKVTTEYFEFTSKNTAPNYFVNWVAVGSR